VEEFEMEEGRMHENIKSVQIISIEAWPNFFDSASGAFSG